jgi:hypothetical protein
MMASVAFDFEEGLRNHTTTTGCAVSGGLPDGNEIMKCDMDVRTDLNLDANIVPSGGSTMFQSGVPRRSYTSRRRH